MLYIIKVVQEFGDNDFRYTIKIGYTSDWKKRKIQYESYFNIVHTLFLYEEGTLEDESRVLGYFKDHKVFKNEWFEYNPDIIKFFEDNDTIEKIRRSTEKIITYRKNRYLTSINVFLLNYILDSFGELDILEKSNKQKEIEFELGYYDSDVHIEIASKLYNLSEEKIKEHVEKMIIEKLKISESVIVFASEFNEMTDVVKKLKALVEFSKRNEVSELDMNNLFQLIPEKYGDYFRILGPVGIGSCGFIESKVKQEFNRIKRNLDLSEDLLEKIYKIFEVGNKYPKSDVKKTLKGLYEEVGYNKTAKATDLSEYFIIKNVLVGKERLHGFEIISKK